MAIELTRRIFLIGSAAAVAVAAAPLSPFEVQQVVTPQNYLRRAVIDLFASCQNTGQNKPALIEIVVDGKVRWSVTMLAFSGFRLVPYPGEEIERLTDQAFELVCHSEQAIGEITMICKDTIDEGPPVHVVETHTFPNRGPATINYLYPDNSLEARRAREADRPVYDADDDSSDLWDDGED